jgi:hypothetical protein
MTNNKQQSIFRWSEQFPTYVERIAAMAIAQNVYNAFKNAEKLSLVEKE